MKDTTPQNPPPQNSQPPVTRRELIDAISKLYVIQDDPSQLKNTLNQPRKRCCKRGNK